MPSRGIGLFRPADRIVGVVKANLFSRHPDEKGCFIASSPLCSLAYVETLKSTATMKPRDLHRQGDQYNSVYICASSYVCARLAAGSAFSAVEAVLSGKVNARAEKEQQLIQLVCYR